MLNWYHKSTNTFTGTAGLSLVEGIMAVCVAKHCVFAEASPPFTSGNDVTSAFSMAGVSLEELWCSPGVYVSPYSFEVRSITADRKDVLSGFLLSFALFWAPASSFCLALCTQLVCGCRGLLGAMTGIAGTGGRTRGFGLSLGFIPGNLTVVSDPAPGWRKLTLAAEVSLGRTGGEEPTSVAAGLIWSMITKFPWCKIQLGNSASHLVLTMTAVLILILSAELQSVLLLWVARLSNTTVLCQYNYS